MMGPEYFTAAGYITDGDILCVNCGEKRKLPVSDQITVATAESEFQEDGLYCGDCGAIIVDPPVTESFDEEYEYDIGKLATLKLTRETHGFCSCTNMPVRWQFSSTELGIFGGGMLFLGLLVGSYLTVWLLQQ